MENRIMFLIIAILCLFVLFSQTGQTWLRRYIGIDVVPSGTGTKSTAPDTQKKETWDAVPDTMRPPYLKGGVGNA